MRFKIQRWNSGVTIYTPLFMFHVGFMSPCWNKEVFQDIMQIGLLPDYNVGEGNLIKFKWFKEWIFKEVTTRWMYENRKKMFSN